MEDLSIFLRLLIRSATGQRISSYVTTITGPRRVDDEDGPDEFHLVIVDNGRTRLLADPQLRESLYCLRCGACLNACPVYRKVGGHAYGWVYPGPIGAVVSPVLTGLSDARDLPHASSLCGGCREVCPVKINLPRMLLYLRKELSEGETYPREKNVSLLERLAMRGWRLSVSNTVMLGLANRIARVVQRPFLRRGRLTRLPPPLSGWTRYRSFPAVASRPFRRRWRDLNIGTRGPKANS
jgi:L-lactate dehydrogenase complex protein LldF